MMIYCQSNGYGNIDTHAPEYQLGRELYDTQVMVSRIREAKKGGMQIAIDMSEVERLLIAHCRLIQLVGFLRADYNTLKECLQNPGSNRYVADGPPKDNE